MQKSLPDVANEKTQKNFAFLDWVGMEGIELPILLRSAELQIPAHVDAKVSLDKVSSRGIHMSRLYLSAQEVLSKNILTLSLLGKLTQDFLKSHESLSSSAMVQVRFDAPLKRPALKSANEAWRNYPVVLSAVNRGEQPQYFVEILVTYSSTCPASAALSRQLIQEKFRKDFSNQKLDMEQIFNWLGTSEGIVATPHAQRSLARVKIQVNPEFDFATLIDLVEESLQTAVQGAVKREDEQEFALRNGQNLMFCEDAARRVQVSLEAHAEILDYLAEFNHVESLHPHSAVSLISKGKVLRSF